MSISRKKDGSVSLSKTAPGLKKISVGPGWDARAKESAPIDPDANLFLLKGIEEVRSDQETMYDEQLRSLQGSVAHRGNNPAEEGDGDEGSILLDLQRVAPELEKLASTVSIQEAVNRPAELRHATCGHCGTKLARYDLSEDASVETAMFPGRFTGMPMSESFEPWARALLVAWWR